MALTDYSDVSYPVVVGGYPPPPGHDRGAEVKSSRRWSRHPSSLRPALLAETVRDLSDRSSEVARVVQGEPVEVLWPVPSERGANGAFEVPEPDRSYLIARGDNKGGPRTLDLALPGLGEANGPNVDDFDRLELVRLVAILLDGLHRHEVVSAGLDWHTFLFTLDPRPGVVIQSPELLRRLGGEFLAVPPRGEEDREVPAVSPFDADRYRFAVLAYRLLVSHERHGSLDPWTRQGIPGLSGPQAARLWQLWERNAGDAGTRPQAREWREALGV